VSISLVFHPTTSLAQRAEQSAQIEIEEKAARIYSNLSLLSMSDRKAFYKELTPKLKSELWKVQLRSYLSKHPDLTDKQKQAIKSLIAFLTPQVYEISLDSPDWEEAVNKPIQNLTKRILEVFPREVARDLLTILGGSESPAALNFRRISFISGLNDSGCANTKQETNSWLPKDKIKIEQQPFKKISANLDDPEDCDCSTRSDWCLFGSECEQESCQQQQFCGTAFLYICNGLCIFYE